MLGLREEHSARILSGDPQLFAGCPRLYVGTERRPKCACCSSSGFSPGFDSYDIYDEEGRTAYTVEGKLSWGHRLEIYGPAGDHLGTVKEEVLTLLPRFALYAGEEYLGCIRKEFALFHPRFTLDCNGWEVEGSFLEWDYAVTDPAGRTVMAASKELLHWTDTYVLDIARPEDALLCLMIVLAIDAAKCSAGNG